MKNTITTQSPAKLFNDLETVRASIRELQRKERALKSALDLPDAPTVAEKLGLDLKEFLLSKEKVEIVLVDGNKQRRGQMTISAKKAYEVRAGWTSKLTCS